MNRLVRYFITYISGFVMGLLFTVVPDSSKFLIGVVGLVVFLLLYSGLRKL